MTRPLEALSELRFDVVVLGGGPAGCVLAARLTEDPSRTVCLVEAGPDYGPYSGGRWPDDMLDGRQLAFSHAWERDDEEDRSALQAKIIGGCSTHNACAVMWGSPGDYEWGEGWTFEAIEPYLRRAQETIRTRLFWPEEVSPWHRSFLEAAQELGIPRVRDPNTPDSICCAAAHPVNAIGPLRWNAAFAYLDPARNRHNLTIADEALADRVLFAGNRATDVVVHRRGRRLELRAGAVVVAASAYGSPGILMRSGIGPAAELRRLGLAVAADLPVGQGLTDHAGVGASWAATATLHEETGRFEQLLPLFMGQVTVKAQSSACAETEWDLFVFTANEPAETPGQYEANAAVFAMKPRSRGQVRIRSADPARPPAVDHGFLSDPSDADAIAEGVELLRRLAATEPVQRYAGEELRPGPDADVAEYVRANVRGFFHPVATCALGPVCGADGRVHGFDNLYVADASFVPRLPRANTHLTVLAAAERLAEAIRR